jgi:hypothetical protein
MVADSVGPPVGEGELSLWLLWEERGRRRELDLALVCSFNRGIIKRRWREAD